jgi:deoxyribodipyrimidine photolyase-related protein
MVPVPFGICFIAISLEAAVLSSGLNACPLNSLYWNFIDQNYEKFASNHRMSFPVRNWDKMELVKKIEIREHAAGLLSNLDTL